MSKLKYTTEAALTRAGFTINVDVNFDYTLNTDQILRDYTIYYSPEKDIELSFLIIAMNEIHNYEMKNIENAFDSITFIVYNIVTRATIYNAEFKILDFSMEKIK